MNKIIPPLIIFGIVCSLIYLNKIPHVNEALNKSYQCELIDKACAFSTEHASFRLNFQQAPQVEEELLIYFDLSDDLRLKQAYIEGVNMYMGTMPVIFKDAHTTRLGVSYLGSCHQSTMRWSLTMLVENAQAQIKHYRVYFNT